MITYSIIHKSQLEGAHRLDAEYYQPEYLLALRKLKGLKYRKLGEIAFVTDGEHGSPDFDENSGIKYFSSQYVREGYFDLTDIKYINKKIHERNKRSQLREEDILLSIVGTVGNAACVTEDLLPANTDRNVSTIRIINREFPPGYVTVFLNSKFGKAQTLREATGNVQPIMILGRVREIVIPQIDRQKEVADLYKKGISAFKESEKFYAQAEDLLLQELDLKDFRPKDNLSYVVNLSETKSANRMDADYFQPKYKDLMLRIKKFSSKSLEEMVTMKKGFEPGSDEYLDNGRLFIRVSNLSKFGLIGKDQKYLSEEMFQNLKSNFQPKMGEILLTKDATLGTAYALKEPLEGIISSGIMRLKLKEGIDSEYLGLCINSLVGQMQIHRDAGGSVIVHWKPEQIKQLQIPILPKTTQQKIADLVRKSLEARKKAKELLEQAKEEVERIIEKA